MSDRDYRDFLPWENLINDSCGASGPDDRSGNVYLLDPGLKLAVETAIVVNRPLLISGHPGSGKSSFAAFVARNLKCRYYELNINRRTESQDLLWSFDALARLRDAQAGLTSEDIAPSQYISPGVLWWALNRKDALEFLKEQQNSSTATEANQPFCQEDPECVDPRSVVLIDEIDKADPDVPNDLLELLGLYSFSVKEIDRHVARAPIPTNLESDIPQPAPLIIMTTNEDRDLPAAFLRRCVRYKLTEPSDEELMKKRYLDVGQLHLQGLFRKHTDAPILSEAIAAKCASLRHAAGQHGPSVAEFIDAVRAAVLLGITVDSPLWQEIQRSTLTKQR